MRLILFKVLRDNVDKIASLIYNKALKDINNIGIVSEIFERGLQRIKNILRWFYFTIFITMVTYITYIKLYVKNIFINFVFILEYMQNIGKKILEFILTLTGPLSPEVLNNIWLFMVLLCILIIIIIFIKLIKYILLKRKEINKEKELFEEELLNKLKEYDEILKKKKKMNIEEILLSKIEKNNIKVNEIINKIDSNKIK